MFSTVQQRFAAWALRRQRYDHGAILLTQRSIYIIPTRQGLMLAVVLVLMLLGDINYNLSLGYILTFLLAMMAVMSMLHAFRNLAQLEISPGRADSVFCGEPARFIFYVRNRSKLARYQLCLRASEADSIPTREQIARGIKSGKAIGYFKTFRQWRQRSNNRHSICFDVPPQQDSPVAFPVDTKRRGWVQTGRLTIYSEFPLGLFYAWSYVNFSTRCLVYPKPFSDAALPFGDSAGGKGKRSVPGDDDFSGLRKYVAGDALPRISWKAYARERGLQVKQFTTPVGEELWLDYSDAPDRTEEEKLSRMTRWVLDAEAQGLRYGLRLPDGEIPPNSGTAQRDECLRRITLFNLPRPEQA